jgi:hypothetical protein
MRTIIALVALSFVSSLPANAADESKKTQWVETGGECPGEDWDLIKDNKKMQADVGVLFCSNAGKVFSGKIRCKDDRIQAACE